MVRRKIIVGAGSELQLPSTNDICTPRCVLHHADTSYATIRLRLDSARVELTGRLILDDCSFPIADLMRCIAIMAALLLGSTSWSAGAELPTNAQSTVTATQAERFEERAVGVTGATRVVVRFEAAELDPGATILITAEDGSTQRFEQASLQQWKQHSAVFNGSSVRIRIEAPGGRAARYTATLAQVQDRSRTHATRAAASRAKLGAVIGADDRVSIVDPRVGRIQYLSWDPTDKMYHAYYCTGWLTSIGAVLSAGHCMPNLTWLMMVEFNVPPSQPDGTPGDAAPIDQYVLNHVAASNQGIGKDWHVLKPLTNSSGQSAYDRQGGFFRLSTAMPSNSLAPLVQVTGYGADSSPPGIKGAQNRQSLTEQTDSGLWVRSQELDCIAHLVDVDEANSGSPIFWPSSGTAIGIHTGFGACLTGSNTNAGTFIGQKDLEQALKTFALREATNATAVFVDGRHPNASDVDKEGAGGLFSPYQHLSSAIKTAAPGRPCSPEQQIINVTRGHYEGLSFKATNACPFKIVAPAGAVLIGPRPLP